MSNLIQEEDDYHDPNLSRNNHQIRSPTVIEEEPVHEFYARVVCCRAETITSAASTITVPPPPPSSRSRSIAVIDHEPNSDVVDNKTTSFATTMNSRCEFSKLYTYALRNPAKFSTLQLNEKNKGFQMLAKMGWKEKDGGLGKHRQGRMIPIQITFRPDQRGFGLGRKREARISHSCSKPSQKESSSSSRRISQERKKRRNANSRLTEEQQLEKRARLMLRTDIPVQYEDLYNQLL